MDRLIDAAIGYPTAIFTALLLVVLVYWLLALVGWVDFESSGIDVELQADGDPGEISTLAGYVVAMGLSGVPFSIVLSVLVLVSWTLSCLAGEWLMPLVPTLPLHIAVGTGVLLLSVALAIFVTALMVRPLRGLFVTHQAMGNASLVGQTCTVMSQRVDQRSGHAEVAQRGAGIQIRVWTPDDNRLTKGDAAVILAYDETANGYRIEPEP
ncbi:MAG: ubiquinone biosynthesis protein [Betaproteobacteria bacterium HGW-Betaproteobacteria-9]|jgi:hypothetical protein|nr:MAG: ubiquinone biosynthesis protein [Betaproteobacteria bacterium HGW-Betaproteobacteria-9]